MTKDDFVMWLNGWVELNGGGIPNEQQWQMIKEHLGLVFKKVTPPLGGIPPIPKLGPVGPIDWNQYKPIPLPDDAAWQNPFPYHNPLGIPKNTVYC